MKRRKSAPSDKPVLLEIFRFAVIVPIENYNPRRGYLPNSITSVAGVCQKWRSVYQSLAFEDLKTKKVHLIFDVLMKKYEFNAKQIRHYFSLTRMIEKQNPFSGNFSRLNFHCEATFPNRDLVTQVVFETNARFKDKKICYDPHSDARRNTNVLYTKSGVGSSIWRYPEMQFVVSECLHRMRHSYQFDELTCCPNKRKKEKKS